MSVCVSVIPVCATNQELTFSQFVSALSVYANYQLSATFVQPIRSRILSVSQLICVKLCIQYLVISWFSVTIQVKSSNTQNSNVKFNYVVIALVNHQIITNFIGLGSWVSSFQQRMTCFHMFCISLSLLISTFHSSSISFKSLIVKLSLSLNL